MGTAEEWQEKVTEEIRTWCIVDYIFNPRRENWDSSLPQTITNSEFREQVEWEHEHIVISDIVFFYFSPETKSPITLMELGLVAGMNKNAVVVCPPGFWRKGNIEVLCHNSNIPLFESLEEGLQNLHSILKESY